MINCRHIIRYHKLINYYKSIVVEGFVEKHHILPKCLGGSNNIDNLIALPPRAHYIAHYLLWKAYPEYTPIAHAFAMMAVNNPYQHRIMKGKLYQVSKIARSLAMKGKKLSEEVKIKMRKPKCDQHRLKLLGNKNAAGNKGNKYKVRSKEHRDALAKATRWYHTQRTQTTLVKIQTYRDQFQESTQKRSAFALAHGIPLSTMKRYLRGL